MKGTNLSNTLSPHALPYFSCFKPFVLRTARKISLISSCTSVTYTQLEWKIDMGTKACRKIKWHCFLSAFFFSVFIRFYFSYQCPTWIILSSLLSLHYLFIYYLLRKLALSLVVNKQISKFMLYESTKTIIYIMFVKCKKINLLLVGMKLESFSGC